jgi:hypothetical protein
MSITLDLPPEIEAALVAEAEARCVPLDNLLEEVIRRFAEMNTPVQPHTAGRLQKEGGIWVLSTGEPMPSDVVQDTLNAIRQERDLGNLGPLR